MRLGTLLVVGALVFGGLFVARNADDWMARSHEAKAHLVAAANDRVAEEEARIGAAVKKRLAKERAKAAAALKKRLEQERAKAAAALKKQLEQERARTVDALKESLAKERARDDAGTRAARQRVPAPPEVPEPPTVPEPKVATAAMTEAEFWRLMSETWSQAGDDTAMQSELLQERLTQLSPEVIVEFAQIRRSLDERASTWDLWGAAPVIEGCFQQSSLGFPVSATIVKTLWPPIADRVPTGTPPPDALQLPIAVAAPSPS
jgi:exonuclease VII large subunit